MDAFLALPRPPLPVSGPDHEQLPQFLDFFRATLWNKCVGLTNEQLAMRPVETSAMSLLGLIRHAALVEAWWFAWVFDGQTTHLPFAGSDDEPDVEFLNLDDTPVDEVAATYLATIEQSRTAVAGRSLDTLAARPRDDGRSYDLRWILIHTIEEYARHCGHADLLRELIDGVTGY
jgi:hypothetical protein